MLRRTTNLAGPEAGFTMVEMLVVAAIILIIGGIAIPKLMKARVNAGSRACETAYKALNGEISNELNKVLLQGVATSCGTGPSSNPAQDVVTCVLGRHTKEKNPRNVKVQTYTTSAVFTDVSSCQVQVTATATNTIRFQQRLWPAGVTVRTQSHQDRSFSIQM